MDRRGRKGQIIFEFIVASVLFFVILVYVLTTVNGQVAFFTSGAGDASLQAAAIRVSEQLITSPGKWDFLTPAVSQIGVGKGNGILDQQRIGALQGFCNTDYPRVRSLLDLGERPFATPTVKVLITNATGTVLDCGPIVSAERPAFIERAALQENGAAAKVLVWVW